MCGFPVSSSSAIEFNKRTRIHYKKLLMYLHLRVALSPALVVVAVLNDKRKVTNVFEVSQWDRVPFTS